MSTPEAVFGRRRTGVDAARAVAAHLALWLPLGIDPATRAPVTPGAGTYLPNAATLRGLPDAVSGRALLPSSIRAARVFQPRGEDTPPFVRVVPLDQAVVDRDGEWASIDVTCHVYSIVLGESTEGTADVLTCYEAAVVLCLEQQPVAGVDGVWWLGGGDGEEIDSDDERTRQGRVDVFVIRLERALKLTSGPASPSNPESSGYVAETVDLETWEIQP